MFWVDEVVEEIKNLYPGKKDFIIRDEKTLSGRVHVGSLRGVVLHGVVNQALKENGFNSKFIYEFNDFDPMDGLPIYLDKAVFEQEMGKPLKDVPAPNVNNDLLFEEENNARLVKKYGEPRNFAEYFGNEFAEVIDSMGFNVEYSLASERYLEGLYDKWMEIILNHEDDIRGIYKDVSGSIKDKDWHPCQVVCENCGKVGTTKVTNWDGKEVTYVCMADMVKWAKGCGHSGKISPFKGKAKLPWKVEWPVKWAGYQVDIEGAGKDHCAAGGSHDVAEKICAEVLKTPVPYNLAYEFFLFGGAKMSSSKGEGASARGVKRILPPELLRFLMIRNKPLQPIEFNPEGDTIPRLFDKYDECADHYFEKVENVIPDFQRAFHFSQIDLKKVNDVYRPRFSRLVFLMQMPHLDISKEVEKIKGSPLNEDDLNELEKRLFYVRLWLNEYAPESYKFTVQEQVPELAHDLDAEQKSFLKAISELLTNQDYSGEELHAQIHEVRKNSTLQPREGFGAIYAALIGKDSGPQAGWFLDSLDKSFVIERFTEVASLAKKEKPVINSVIGKMCTIDAQVVERFKGVKTALAVIEGVKISASSSQVEELKKQMLEGVDFADIKKNSASLAEFKAMYKAFGVDPTKRKPSPVALIDRLANGKDLYKINTLVDIYNLVVIKHQVSFGAFDLDNMAMPLVLRFSDKGEKFIDLTDGKERPLDEGELIYADSAGLVIARDYNHRDSLTTIVTEKTVNVLLQADGNAALSEEKVMEAFEEAITLITKYCGGVVIQKEYLASS